MRAIAAGFWIIASALLLTGCETLEYQNVRDLHWTILVLVAFSAVGAIAAIARFIWKSARGQPVGRPVTAQWGSRWWWWLPWGRWWGTGGGFGDGGDLGDGDCGGGD